MYEFVAGELAATADGHVVVDVGGIGYMILAPTSTIQALQGQTRVRLHTVLRIREEQMQLFGFATEEERAIFRRVCTVAGVGPGIALAILSGIPIAEFRQAVVSGQPKVLQRIKGVGKKTAERIVLELGEVLPVVAQDTGPPQRSAAADEAIAAMVKMGYAPGDAEAWVQKACEQIPGEATAGEVVRVATRLERAR